MSFANRYGKGSSTQAELSFTAKEVIGTFGGDVSETHKELVFGHWTGHDDAYYIINVKAGGKYGKGIKLTGEELDELASILNKG